MGQVDDDLANLFDGQLAALEGGVELDLQQLGLVLRRQHSDGEQSPLAQVDRVVGPHGPEEVVDGDVGVAPGEIGGVDGEAVDLLHLGHAGGARVLWFAHAGLTLLFVTTISLWIARPYRDVSPEWRVAPGNPASPSKRRCSDNAAQSAWPVFVVALRDLLPDLPCHGTLAGHPGPGHVSGVLSLDR